MYEQLGVSAKVVQGSTFKVYVQPSTHCLYLIHAPEICLKIAWIHTCFHHFMEIGQIFHNR